MIRRIFPVLVMIFVAACGTAPDAPEGARGVADATSGGAGDSVSADSVEIVGGVADRNRDPAVVAVDIGGEALCTGTLVSPRIVLTARHCVSDTVEAVDCPATGAQISGNRDPSKIAILVGDDVATADIVAHGESFVVPSGTTLCDHDIALILLDTPITRMKPLAIRATGAAKGDRVRAVGYGLKTTTASAAGVKLVREHVKVLDVETAEFTVGEATCNGDSGGPAIDEDTGEIVGVVSRGGPTCDGPDVHNIYTRVDAFSSLIADAFDRAGDIVKPDGGAPAPKGTKSKPPSDVGGPCEKGADCAAGVCLTDGDRQYCSRPCGAGDRCPTNYNCKSVGTTSACVNVR